MKIEKLRAWSSECDEGLCYALGSDRDELVAGVNEGRLECYRLWDGEAYMITRTERGVVTCCCYQGARLREAAAWVIDRCRQIGITEVRFHTQRPALSRMLKPFHFQPVEQVFATRIDPVH
jgi:hypothetical protein